MSRNRLYVVRRGNVAVLTAFLMIGLAAMVALAVDIGYLMVTRGQLQRTADAAAIASAWELVDPNGPKRSVDYAQLTGNVEHVAGQYAALNPVLMSTPTLAHSDVQLGFIANPTDPNSPFQSINVGPPNAVQVSVRRTADQNGEVPLFFARVLGIDKSSVRAKATAVLVNSVAGFQPPADGSNLQLLPFALDEPTWNDLVDFGIGDDNYRFDPDTKTVKPGSDGIREVNLYPLGTGSPGNRGTVDIGGSNNSTADIARQITSGISAEDMANFPNSKLEFDASGELSLNGDTGISAGIKDELTSIIGKPRIIPIFRQVAGPGNNAQYTIVQFAGVRVLYVKLTGSMSSKKVIIQPCNIVAKGSIPSATPGSSHFVYSPVWLAR